MSGIRSSGRYLPVQRLGMGSFASVYLCETIRHRDAAELAYEELDRESDEEEEGEKEPEEIEWNGAAQREGTEGPPPYRPTW